MKKTLVAQAKPGMDGVYCEQNKHNQPIPHQTILVHTIQVWESKERPKKVKPDVILPYLKHGYAHSERRKVQIKMRNTGDNGTEKFGKKLFNKLNKIFSQ